jgi:hypothetical protein
VHGRKRGRLLRPDDLDAQVRLLHELREVPAQRRPRLAQVPASIRQDFLDRAPVRRLDRRRPGREDATLRFGHVRHQLSSQPLVALSLRCHRQPQHVGTIQQRHCEDLTVATPRPGRSGCHVGTELPEPSQVARMQLHRRGVVLPFAQSSHDSAELLDRRGLELDGHA